jgi:hypothetical protein
LPAELLEIIAEFLAGEFKLGSLANLNVASRDMHEITSAVLWTTVWLDTFTPRWNSMLQVVLPDDCEYPRSPAGREASRIARDTFERRKDIPGALPKNRRRVK